MEATYEALIQLERWFEYWRHPLNPSKCEASFFSVNPYQANLQPRLFLFNSRLLFNPTQTFLGITFDRTLSFYKHVSSLKAKFFPRLKVLRYIPAFSWSPSKDTSFFCVKLFFGLLLTYALPVWCYFIGVTILTTLERLHRASNYAIFGCLSSSPIPLLLSEASLPPLRITVTHFALSSYKRVLFVSQPPFPFQIWPDQATLFYTAGSVCSPLKPTLFCKLFAVLISTNKFTILLSSYLTLALSLRLYSLLRLSFYRDLSGRSGRNCLLCCPALSG